MFIFHYIKKDGLNTIPCNQVCHLIAALGLCEIFKQETCHKPEWCELEPYDPAHIIGPQGVVPWTDSYTGKPYTGYIFRNKNQNHINQSVPYGPANTAEPVLTCVLQSRKTGKALAAERYDLVLLDLNLPKVDGMQVLRTLRRQDLETCVLILSARSEIADKVEGLDAGANDYLSKPFHLAELEARVRSLTRRKFIQQDVCLCCGRLSFNTRSRVAAVDGQTLALTRKESGVLEYLLLHQGRPVSQEELIEHVWDGSVDSFSNSIRVHISALRKKLRAALGYDPIRNRIGEGYEIGGEVQ